MPSLPTENQKNVDIARDIISTRGASGFGGSKRCKRTFREEWIVLERSNISKLNYFLFFSKNLLSKFFLLSVTSRNHDSIYIWDRYIHFHIICAYEWVLRMLVCVITKGGVCSLITPDIWNRRCQVLGFRNHNMCSDVDSSITLAVYFLEER